LISGKNGDRAHLPSIHEAFVWLLSSRFIQQVLPGEAKSFGNQTELAKDVWPAQRSMIDQLGSLVMHSNPALNPIMASL